jgi:tetratricopeptide (TPR) repeat protein
MAVLFAQLILLGVLAVGPWLFGGVRAETQAWFAAAVLAALGCVLVSRLRRGAPRVALPAAVLPLVIGLALGAAQLIPLDPGTAAFLSPAGARFREDFQAPISPAEAALAAQRGAAAPERQPLSLYPASTRYDLSLLILAVAAFFLGAAVFHTPAAQRGLCFVVAVNGAAIAAFAIVYKLISLNDSLYWRIALPRRAQLFGPFVNRNNAAGYLTLCLAAALGTLIWIVRRARQAPLAGPGFPSPRTPRLAARLKRRVTESLARLDAAQILGFSLAACIVAGIVCSLSRGAWVATAGAVVLTGLVALATRRWFAPAGILGLVAVAGIALAMWVGMSRSAAGRLAVLLDATHSPWHHWEDSCRAVPDFWRAGSGLGTYRYVYGLYQDHPRKLWYYHAENQYLETLVEAGVLGLGLVVATIALVGWGVWHVLRKDSDPEGSAFGIVALFALGAQVVHAMFDFGLYIPANMLTFAVICGAVVGRAAQLAAESQRRAFLTLPRVGWAPAAWAVALGAACAWGFTELRRAAAIETAIRDTDFEETPSGASASDLEEAISRLTAALEIRPDDAEAHTRVGILWTHLYHLRAFERLRRGRTLGAMDEASLWGKFSSGTSLQLLLHTFARDNNTSALLKLRTEPVVVENLQPALTHFLRARRWCPLIAEPHVGLGELYGLVADPAEDGLHLERVRRLEPTAPKILFQCGLLDFQAGRLDAAYASWKTCLSVSDDFLEPIVLSAANRLDDLETVRKLFPESPRLLVGLARGVSVREEDSQEDKEKCKRIRSALGQRALELLAGADLPEEETWYWRALAFECREEYAEAIQSYDRAVRLRPRYLRWRQEYAMLLERQEKIGEAIDQVILLGRMVPDDVRVQNWLRRLYKARYRNGASPQ